jgi:hypothetical protein
MTFAFQTVIPILLAEGQSEATRRLLTLEKLQHDADVEEVD